MFSIQSSHCDPYAQPPGRVSVIKNGFMEMLPASSISPVPLSPHAEVRHQQRGIRRDVLDCLVAYGRREHDHSHCEIIYFVTVQGQRVQARIGSPTHKVEVVIAQGQEPSTVVRAFLEVMAGMDFTFRQTVDTVLLKRAQDGQPETLEVQLLKERISKGLMGVEAEAWPPSVLDFVEAEQESMGS